VSSGATVRLLSDMKYVVKYLLCGVDSLGETHGRWPEPSQACSKKLQEQDLVNSCERERTPRLDIIMNLTRQ